MSARLRLVVPVFVVSAIACYGQSVGAVTDAAAYGPRVSPGSLASIFGSDLASSTDYAQSFPLPTSLGGATVEISGSLVPLTYASATQINFQVPSGLAAGDNTLIVHAPSGDTSSFTFTVATQAPSIFQYGTNHAVIQNYPSYALNSDTAPAPAGSTIIVYLTGQGTLDNPVPDGSAAPPSPVSNATATATATVEGKNATIQFLGLTPGFAGLAQANIVVPTLPTGDYPLVITIGGTLSASAIVSVSGSGTAFVSPLVQTGAAYFPVNGDSHIALAGNVAYVCDADHITMVNVSTPSAPTVIGEFGDSDLNGLGTTCTIATNPTTGNPFLVDIVGHLEPQNSPPQNMAFATWDLANLTSPVLLGVTQTQYPYIVDISFYANYGLASTSYFTYNQGNLAITAQTGEFLAFDFTNPAAPQEVSILTTIADTSLKPFATVIDQLYSYVCSSTATGTSTIGNGMLYVINTGVPSELTSQYQVEDRIAAIYQSLAISGNTLLVVGNTYGNRNPGTPDFDFIGNLTLTTMNIALPSTPVILNSVNTGIQVNGTFYTTAFSNGIFAIVTNPPTTDNDGPESLMVVDARTPAQPVAYPVQTQFGFSGMLATSGGYLLASNSLGFFVYTLQWK